ncbi:MAG: FtsQ-type POTRA domain-containing protein [Pseudomonadota bacterium]
MIARRWRLIARRMTLLAGVGVGVMLLAGMSFDALSRLPKKILSAVKNQGYSVQNILVQGHHMVTHQEITHASQVDIGTPILSLDMQAVRAQVETLPWVKSAQVSKRLPSTLEIIVQEHAPVALWQRGQDLFLIADTGEILAPYDRRKPTRLPLVIGAGARDQVRDLLAALAQHEWLAKDFLAATWIGHRRWDVFIRNGPRIAFPQGDMNQALERLKRLQHEARGQLMTQVTSHVDLRLPDRIFVQDRPLSKIESPAGNVGQERDAPES